MKYLFHKTINKNNKASTITKHSSDACLPLVHVFSCPLVSLDNIAMFRLDRYPNNGGRGRNGDQYKIRTNLSQFNHVNQLRRLLTS